MYGYQPPKRDDQAGSWGEIFAMVGVVFMELARPLLAILVTLGLALSTLILFFTSPLYALLPLSALVGFTWYMVRRDRQSVRDAEDALPPHRQ